MWFSCAITSKAKINFKKKFLHSFQDHSVRNFKKKSCLRQTVWLPCELHFFRILSRCTVRKYIPGLALIWQLRKLAVYSKLGKVRTKVFIIAFLSFHFLDCIFFSFSKKKVLLWTVRFSMYKHTKSNRVRFLLLPQSYTGQ